MPGCAAVRCGPEHRAGRDVWCNTYVIEDDTMFAAGAATPTDPPFLLTVMNVFSTPHISSDTPNGQ